MKLLLIVVIAVSAVAALPPNCDYSDLKKCNTIEKYIAPDGGVKWPTDLAGVTQLCGDLKGGAACLAQFNTRCIKDNVWLTLLHEIHDGLTKHYNEVCDADSHKQDFLNRASQCYAKPEVESGLQAVHKRYVGLVEAIEKLEKPDRKLAFCCSVLYVRENGKAVNEKYCTKDIANYVDSALVKILVKPFEANCGGVKTQAECFAKLSPANRATFDKIVSANPPLPTTEKYALPALYRIYVNEHP